MIYLFFIKDTKKFLFTEASDSQADDQGRNFVCDPFNSETKKQEINLTLMLHKKEQVYVKGLIGIETSLVEPYKIIG